ncbi:MAG: hypothetical protein IJ281_01490 [Clostridia bacterium]|nr:hypothetical protein [Clostridia bacterium]
MKIKTIRNCIVLGCIVLAVVLLAAFCVDIFSYNTGVVTGISAVETGEGEWELNLTYFLPMGGYSVRTVPADEGVYIGDGMVEYNGDLGTYRILITFGDMEPHRSFSAKKNEDGIITIQNGSGVWKAKIAHPSDHGFVLYIGSDTPICAESKSESELDALGGVIRIPIRTGEEE